MQTTNQLNGVLPVFQTPFHDDECIDWDTLAVEIDWLYNAGADGLVMAMVSEVLRLSTEERRQVAEFVCSHGGGLGPVVISVGAESSHTAQQLAEHAAASGAAAVMAIPPVSVTLDETELTRYYTGILEAVDLPVIVQDASSYVGRPMSIALQAELLEAFSAQVMFKPEAEPIGPRLTELRDATCGQAIVFEGSGGIALVDSYRRGIVGTMPGADLIKPIVALWNALKDGDAARVEQLSGPLVSLVSLQGSLDAFLAVEKHLLVKQEVFRNEIVRGPVSFRLDEKTRNEVDRLFDRLMSIVDVG